MPPAKNSGPHAQFSSFSGRIPPHYYYSVVKIRPTSFIGVGLGLIDITNLTVRDYAVWVSVEAGAAGAAG